MANGIMGKFIRVDLNKGIVNIRDLPEENVKMYLGGMGMGTKILWEFIKKYETEGIDVKTMDPFSPLNPIIVANGPGTGLTGFPSPGRHHVMCMKSPLTGSIGSANAGGTFGAYMKKAGFDGMLIEGKSEKPVYLSLLDGKVELKPAEDLWGKTTYETTDMLMERYKDVGYRISVSTIGPAGENMTHMASIMNDKHRAAGRTGIGAVMGSKNLKAMVVGGNQIIEVNDKEKFREITREKLKMIKENGVSGEGLPAYGTAVLVNVLNNVGSLPTNNFQKAYHPTAEKISGETLAKEILIKNDRCWGCSIACARRTSIKEGKYKIDEFDGPEYETLWSFGSDCGVDDLEAIVKANDYCDMYGMDTISMGATVACAMELAEKGYMPKEDYEGIDLRFGSAEAIVELSRLAGLNEGLGKKLAMGSYRLAEMYGHPELSMTCRKLDMPAYDPRGVKGIGLNYATANRGGCHVTGYTVAPEIVGMPQQLDRLDYPSKPAWVKAFQDLTTVVNSTVNCLFTTFALGAPDFAALLSAVTGWDLDADKIMHIGERIYNLQRLIMKKIGAETRDKAPERLKNLPLPDGVSKGETFDLDKMLGEYYKVRGWNDDGTPTQAKIDELGIENEKTVFINL